MTEAELRNEVDKAKSFQPALSRFILATTAQNDAKIQQLAREITVQHRAQGLFDVEVCGWEEIQTRLADYSEVVDKHFPNQGPTQNKIFDTLQELKANDFEADGRCSAQHNELLAQGKVTQELVTTFLSRQALFDTELQDTVDAVINEEMDRCRDLLTKYKAQTALELLTKLQEDKWNNVTDKTKFRIVTNIAAANLSLGNIQLAADGFLEAEKYNPKDEKAQCNVAFAYLLSEDWAQASAKARQAAINYHDSNRALGLLISASIHDLTVDDPTTLLHTPDVKSAEVAFALAHFYSRRTAPEKALFWIRRAYDLDSASLEIRRALAEHLLQDLIQNESVTLGKQFSEQQKADAKLAHDILSELWNKIRNTEIAKQFSPMALNLSISERLLGKNDKAREIAEEGHQRNPSDPELKFQLGLLNHISGNFPAAIADLEDILESLSPEQTLVYVEALKEAGQYSRAESLLGGLLSGQLEPDSLLNARFVQIELLKCRDGVGSALAYAQELTTQYPTNIRLTVITSQLQLVSGKKDAAIESINAAERLLNDASRYSERMAVANALYDLEEFSDAIPLFEDLCSQSEDSKNLHRLLSCLYEADRRTALQQKLSKLPDAIRSQPFYRQLSTGFYLRTGDLGLARENCEAYLEQVPSDIKMRMHWIQILHQLEDHAAIRGFIENSIDISEAELETRLFYVRILTQYGKVQEALKIAYEARRKFCDQPQAHLAMIGLTLFRDDLPFPEKVEVDTVFTLQDAVGEKRVFIIESASDPEIRAGEIPPQHPLSQKALGHRLHDRIVVTDTVFQKDERQIVSVQHKYVHALHESRDKFHELFPGDHRLTQVRIQSGDDEQSLQPILSAVSARSESVSRIEQLYNTHPFPIGVIATLLGINPIDAWIGLLGNAAVKIICCLGAEPERMKAFGAIDANEQGYIVGPLTLFMMHILKIQDSVYAVTGRLGITQSTLSLLKDLLQDRKAYLQHGNYLTLSKEGAQFVGMEVTKEDVGESIRKIEEILGWTTAHCDIIPAIAKSDSQHIGAHTENLMHPAFFDTLLAADGSGRTLLCDDFHLRSLGKQIFNLEGVWLQPLLMKALEKKCISTDLYFQTVVTLVRCNYSFTTVDANLLIRSTKGYRPTITPDFRIIAGSLGGEKIDLISVMRVVIPFLHYIWNHPFLTLPEKEQFLWTTLNELNADRKVKFEIIIGSLLGDGFRLRSFHSALQEYAIVRGKGTGKSFRLREFYSALYQWLDGHFLIPAYREEFGKKFPSES